MPIVPGQMTFITYQGTGEFTIPANAEAILISELVDAGNTVQLTLDDRNGNSQVLTLSSAANLPISFTKNPKGGYPSMTVNGNGNTIQVIATYSPKANA